MQKRIELTCKTCGETFLRYISNDYSTKTGFKFCSRKCFAAFQKGKNLCPPRQYVKKQLFLVSCAYCNQPIYRWRFELQRSKNHFCNSKCKGKWSSLNLLGNNACNWKGGLNYLTHKILTNSRYLKIRKQVLTRDNSICALCQSNIKPEVHHIIEKKKNILLVFDQNNMIILCKSCHIKIRGNEENYIGLFNDIVEKKANSGKPKEQSMAIPSQASEDNSLGVCRDYIPSVKTMR